MSQNWTIGKQSEFFFLYSIQTITAFESLWLVRSFFFFALLSLSLSFSLALSVSCFLFVVVGIIYIKQKKKKTRKPATTKHKIYIHSTEGRTSCFIAVFMKYTNLIYGEADNDHFPLNKHIFLAPLRLHTNTHAVESISLQSNERKVLLWIGIRVCVVFVFFLCVLLLVSFYGYDIKICIYLFVWMW